MNSCCSNRYSHDGKLKCTPVGGFKPDQGCVYGCRGYRSCAYATYGDWMLCTRSGECSNGCCSKRYSHDGNLKCTPVGGFIPDQGCVA
jgi:hypothetical protein